MRRTVGIAAAVTVALGGGAAWWFSQGTEAPTVGVTAPAVETTTTAAGSSSTPGVAAGGPMTYTLTDASRAVFSLDESLRGSPSTVVGVSPIVLGEVVVDLEEPSSLQIGRILVNARAFETDSGNRNRAIRGPILQADTFEFIEFAPTSIDDLAGTADGAFSFTVTGDLTIRQVTNPASFDVTVSVADNGVVRGTARGTVNRTDWQLDIPRAPGVADVSEEVQLILDFEAAPVA